MAQKAKNWKQAELILHFQLNKLLDYTPLMQEWLEVNSPVFTSFEEQLFTFTYQEGRQNISYWSEGDLKMYFISNILRLSGLMTLNEKGFVGVFGRYLTATIPQTKLSVRCDFLAAKGFKNIVEDAYFHFQVYKPELNPKGESMAQILEAFLIGQAKNKKQQPLYGCEVIGKQWTFVIMEGKNYCVSKSFDCTEEGDLLKIIAILRKFKGILETRLLN